MTDIGTVQLLLESLPTTVGAIRTGLGPEPSFRYILGGAGGL